MQSLPFFRRKFSGNEDYLSLPPENARNKTDSDCDINHKTNAIDTAIMMGSKSAIMTTSVAFQKPRKIPPRAATAIGIVTTSGNAIGAKPTGGFSIDSSQRATPVNNTAHTTINENFCNIMTLF